MVSFDTFRTLALSLPQTTEQPHFEKTSYRANNTIFATLDKKLSKACIRLSLMDQDVFSAFDKEAIYRVPNKWGQQGWTFIDLGKVRKDMCTDILVAAYKQATIKKE